MRFLIYVLICLLAGIAPSPSTAQVPGIPEALRFMAFSPKSVADSLKKRGFQVTECIGHPWKDDQPDDICLIQEKSGLMVDISPRQNGKSSEILYMYEGKERYDRHQVQLEKEGFKLLLPADLSPDGKTETWYWTKGSVFARTLFAKRLRMVREDGSESFFEHLYFDDSKTYWEVFNKREPETAWTPGMKYPWSNGNVELQLPAGTKIKSIWEGGSDISLQWPGGEWSTSSLFFYLEKAAGNEPFKKVRSLLDGIVPDRTDSLLFINDKSAGVSLFIVESEGTWEKKPFLSLFFAGQLKDGKLLSGYYTSLIPAKGMATRKLIRQSILASFRKNWEMPTQ